MSSASRRSRLEALKAGHSSSDEEEEEVYNEEEDYGEDLDDFVIDDKDTGYKASKHQRQSAASNQNRNTRASYKSKPRQRGSQQSGSYAISRKRRNVSNRTSSSNNTKSQSKSQKQASVNSYFKKGSARTTSRQYNSKRTAASKPKKSTKTKKNTDDFMSDLLGNLDDSEDENENQGDINNSNNNDNDNNNSNNTNHTMAVEEDTEIEDSTMNTLNEELQQIETQPMSAVDTNPVTQPMTAVPVESMETDNEIDSNPVTTEPPAKRFKFGGSSGSTDQAQGTTTTKKSDKTEMSEDEDEDVDIAMKSDDNNNSNNMFTLKEEEKTKSQKEDAGNTDDYPRGKTGFLDFYWFDAFEDALRKPGEIYLFGKWLNKKNEWKSVCVFVKNIERTMYVLPRLLNRDDDVDVGERADVMEVYNEINSKRQRLGIKKIAVCPVEKRYCFRERKNGIPAMAQYLKCCYSFKCKAFSGPQFDSGTTYSTIFGVNSTALEVFILDKQMMGPCWLRVPIQKAAMNVSWCSAQLELDDPDQLTVLSANYPSPNFKVLSISFQTVFNAKKQHEVAAISGVVSNSVCIDYGNRSKSSATPSTSGHIEYFTLIRKIGKNPIPYDLEKELKLKNYNVNTSTFQSFGTERELLSFFANKIQSLDPDVIVGHSLYDFVLDVIINRMKAKDMKHWSKIGRLRRGKWPFLKSGKLRQRNLGCGRLLADTFMSSQEFLGSEKTYTLSHLSTKLLPGVDHHENLPMDKIPEWWLEGKSLASIVTHVANDANLILQLMHKLEVLPLTKELTNLCGNLWSRSLVSQRAERNEWLLLHEFHRNGWIVPEQLTVDEKVKRGIIPDRRSKTKKRGKAQYAGGLVLEPERGLYDKYVLCLDFNSLYPSIIQEFNLCFSTTEHWKYERNHNDKEGANEVDSDYFAKMQDKIAAETGILPKVIGVLLTRRQSVKKWLKSAKEESERKRLDVQQKALKLVANSMYGCLGFIYSRFYCEPIAALITALGRESLMKARDLSETVGNLRVIYGDTDSIFVYTDTDDLIKARNYAIEVKKKVNKTYKKMYLDLDYVFSKILLLRKKKYAAVKVVGFRTDSQGKAKDIEYKKEIKGLDVVRRDWAIISKQVGQEVLDAILTEGAQIDDTVVKIQELLQKYRTEMDDNKVELKRFCITKKLVKAPSDYPEPGKMPHVMVAMAMRKNGLQVDVGSFIEYIVCKQPRDGDNGGNGNTKAVAQRAYHISEIEKSIMENKADPTLALQVDREWYLEQQILPPVGRYCDPIEGVHVGLLAHALGLDSNKFKHLQRGSNGNNGGAAMMMDDEEDLEDKILRITNPLQKYRDTCRPLKIKCRHCKCEYDFGGVFDFRTPTAKCGLICATPGCKGIVSSNDMALKKRDIASIQNGISMQIWHFIHEYYGREWVCLDLSCSFRTRQIPLNGTRCPKLGCSASMKESYSASQLFDQLRYFAFLFDRIEQTKLLKQEQQNNSNFAGADTALTRHHETVCDQIHQWIKQDILERSRYYFIDCSVIFKYLM